MLEYIIAYAGLAVLVGTAVYKYNPGIFDKRDCVVLGLIWPVTLVGWFTIELSKALAPDD